MWLPPEDGIEGVALLAGAEMLGREIDPPEDDGAAGADSMEVRFGVERMAGALLCGMLGRT